MQQSASADWTGLSCSSAGHEAGGLQSFDISAYIEALHQGDNILAIHGLNTSLGSSDFLICAELVAGYFTGGSDPTVSETAIQFTNPITLNYSVHVKARAFSGDAFSALNEATFAIGPNH